MLKILHNDALAKLVIRLSVGILLLFHGVSKIMNTGAINFITSKLSSAGLPEIMAYGVYIGEVIAPVMIILGVFSRYGAVIIVINMLFAIYLVHPGDVYLLSQHGGWRLELQGFYLFSSIAIVFSGSGRYAFKPD